MITHCFNSHANLALSRSSTATTGTSGWRRHHSSNWRKSRQLSPNIRRAAGGAFRWLRGAVFLQFFKAV